MVNADSSTRQMIFCLQKVPGFHPAGVPALSTSILRLTFGLFLFNKIRQRRGIRFECSFRQMTGCKNLLKKNGFFLMWGTCEKNQDIKKGITCKSTSYPFRLSEWQDSNLRPLAPHASMLANCTTPRFAHLKLKQTIS